MMEGDRGETDSGGVIERQKMEGDRGDRMMEG